MKGDKAASEALQAKYKEQEELLGMTYDLSQVVSTLLAYDNSFSTCWLWF